MSARSSLPIYNSRILCGWKRKMSGWWERGDEAIFRRRHGIWFWYPYGFGGRAVGPFMTWKAARQRALQRL